MLYDPKWAKAPSLAGFIAWLETKDPKEKYDFKNCAGGCLFGQYMLAIGVPWGSTPQGPDLGNWADTNYMTTARQVFGASRQPLTVLDSRPHTFGAALKRARALAAR